MNIPPKIKSYFFDFVIFVAGALLPLAFAPINRYWIAWIVPAVLIAGFRKVSPQRALLRGFLFGLGQFGVGVSWVFISIYVYGNTPIFIASLLTFLMVALLALFPAIQGYLQVRFAHQKRWSFGILIFSSLWIILEWVRSWIFTGFPWMLVAFSQVNSPLKGFIPVLGEYGTGFLVLVMSGLIEFIVRQFILAISRKSRILFSSSLLQCALFILIPLTGFGLTKINWSMPSSRVQSVALVQGNIPQNIKWDPSSVMPTIMHYVDLTKPYWNSNIVVWPEAAIPVPMPEAKVVISQLNDYAAQKGALFFVGIPVQVPGVISYYNAMLLLGQSQGQYYKRHLVPFGEYVPLQSYLRGLIGLLNVPMSNLTPGNRNQPDLHANGLIFAPFICYEIAYWQFLRDAMPRSNLLVAITDDAWFGDSFAPAQQLQIGQFRAIQSGRYLIQAGNNGITAIVNNQGEIVTRLPQFQSGVLMGNITPMQGVTPWVAYGNLPILFLLFFILLLACL